MAVRSLEAVDEGLVDLLVEHQTARRRATLARGANGRKENRTNSKLDIGIVHHDECVVAAQFHNGLAKAALHGDIDLATHLCAAGERDEVHVLVLRHGLADVSAAADERCNGARKLVALEHALDDARHSNRRKSDCRGRLPQAYVAADHRDGVVPAVHGDGEVEGRSDANDAQRVPLLKERVAGAFGGDDLSAHHAAEAHGIVADVDVLLHFAPALRKDLAHLERDEAAERVLVRAKSVANLTHNLAAHGSGHQSPVLPRLLRRLHSVVVLGQRAFADAGDGLVRCRVHSLVHATLAAPFVDEHAVILLAQTEIPEELEVVDEEARRRQRARVRNRRDGPAERNRRKHFPKTASMTGDGREYFTRSYVPHVLCVDT
eukprot:Opistho-1_new@94111